MGEPVVQEVLVLTSDVHAAMVDRALTQAPAEACGLFTGELGTLRVDGYHPMANAADPDEAGKLYVLDGQEMLEVEAEADAAAGATAADIAADRSHQLGPDSQLVPCG